MLAEVFAYSSWLAFIPGGVALYIKKRKGEIPLSSVFGPAKIYPIKRCSMVHGAYRIDLALGTHYILYIETHAFHHALILRGPQ